MALLLAVTLNVIEFGKDTATELFSVIPDAANDGMCAPIGNVTIANVAKATLAKVLVINNERHLNAFS